MLETDWLKVATAGKTIDGRELTPEMLESAGKLYDLEIYTATVNSEHFFYPGLGYVTAVKAEADDQGRMALWAKVVPTAELITRNQAKRQLFYSVELMPGFPEEGDWYLSGLAITDIPASQGLAPQLFKADRRGIGDSQRFLNTGELQPGEIAPWQGKPQDDPRAEGQMPGRARSFLASIKSRLGGGATSPEPEEAMKPEERKELDDLKAAVGELTTAVAKLTAKPGEGEPAADPAAGKEPAKQPEKATPEPGKAEKLVADVVKEQMAEALKPITTDIEAIKAQLKEPVPGTQPLTVDKPSEGGAASPYTW